MSALNPFSSRSLMTFAAVLAAGVIAGCGSDDESTANDANPGVTASEQTPTTTSSETATTATSTVPVQTLQDAQDAIDDDQYAEALAIAAAIGATDAVRRRIANRIARRIMFAVRSGDRSRARFLLTSASKYPTTTTLREARAAYRVAKQRADAQAAARRAAAEQRRHQRAAERAAKRAAREQQQEEATPEPSAPSGGACADTPATNFPVPPGDPRDRDGDGIACES